MNKLAFNLGPERLTLPDQKAAVEHSPEPMTEQNKTNA